MTVEMPPATAVSYLTGSLRLVDHFEHTDRSLTRRDELISIELRGTSVTEILDALARQIAVLLIREPAPSSPLRPADSGEAPLP